VPVSTRIRPVTQVDVVAVKREVMGSVNLPLAEENGIHKRKAPIIITAKKLKTIVLAGYIGFVTVSPL
jgi:hypothetical protein